MFKSLEYNLMSFNNWILLFNYYPTQDAGHFCYPRKFLCASYQLLYTLLYFPDFYHQRLILPITKLHVNGIWHMYLSVWLLSLNIMFSDLSMWLHASAVYPWYHTTFCLFSFWWIFEFFSRIWLLWMKLIIFCTNLFIYECFQFFWGM